MTGQKKIKGLLTERQRLEFGSGMVHHMKAYIVNIEAGIEAEANCFRRRFLQHIDDALKELNKLTTVITDLGLAISDTQDPTDN